MYISHCILRDGDGLFRVATSLKYRGCGSSRWCSVGASAVRRDDVPRRVMQKADRKRKRELACLAVVCQASWTSQLIQRVILVN